MALTDTLHIETVSADKRHVEATMPIVPEVFQPHGYLHGGATIALLETVASIGTEQNTDFDKERPFGIDVQVRHRKSGKEGTLRGVADLDREEVSERTGAVKQYWNVAAYDDAGDVVSDGVIMTKIVSLARLLDAFAGSVTTTTVPRGSLGSRAMEPPCASTMCCASESPSP